MTRLTINIAYNGKDYSGWQLQKNAVSVQEKINLALSQLLKEEIFTVGAGRTDKGVHAKKMIAHFDTKNIIDVRDLTYRLNAILPSCIAINSIKKVASTFHARFSAKFRTYQYFIHHYKSPFKVDTSYYYPFEIDLVKMKVALSYLIGNHDFRSFCKSNSVYKNFYCNITKADIYVNEEGITVFEITANRFLRGMVRAIVGTLLDINTNKRAPSYMQKVIEKKDRASAGSAAKPYGLFLTEISY